MCLSGQVDSYTANVQCTYEETYCVDIDKINHSCLSNLTRISLGASCFLVWLYLFCGHSGALVRMEAGKLCNLGFGN